LLVDLDGLVRGAHILIDDHGHTLLAMGHLTAVEPDGLGVIDQDVVDRDGVFLACDGNEAGLDAWSGF
jgi:hypothetical protein